MLSHRGNVRTSKFWRKSKEKKRIFFRKFTKGILGFGLGQNKLKIISCLCTFKFFDTDLGSFCPGSGMKNCGSGILYKHPGSATLLATSPYIVIDHETGNLIS
jgi:hypothetical protein